MKSEYQEQTDWQIETCDKVVLKSFGRVNKRNKRVERNIKGLVREIKILRNELITKNAEVQNLSFGIQRLESANEFLRNGFAKAINDCEDLEQIISVYEKKYGPIDEDEKSDQDFLNGERAVSKVA